MAVIEVFAGDFFVMDEPDIVTKPFGCPVSDFLSLEDSARTQLYKLSVIDALLWQDYASNRTSIKFVQSSDYLELRDKSGKGDSLFVLDLFFVWEQARLVEDEREADVFNMIDLVQVTVCKKGEDTLTLTDVASMVAVRTRTTSDVLTMTDHSQAYNPNDEITPLRPIEILSGPNAPEV